jgi:hypothetical protein
MSLSSHKSKQGTVKESAFQTRAIPEAVFSMSFSNFEIWAPECFIWWSIATRSEPLWSGWNWVPWWMMWTYLFFVFCGTITLAGGMRVPVMVPLVLYALTVKAPMEEFFGDRGQAEQVGGDASIGGVAYPDVPVVLDGRWVAGQVRIGGDDGAVWEGGRADDFFAGAEEVFNERIIHLVFRIHRLFF